MSESHGAFDRRRPPFSFELYPPRSDTARAALDVCVEHLIAAGPAFISVTYGANGSSRESSLTVLRDLVRHSSIEAMAHLTCVGSSYTEASALIREFLDAGITNFLALRGDPPAGVSSDEMQTGDIETAAELVQLIHRVQVERMPFTLSDVAGFPAAKRLSGRRRVTIAVAGFPNGHPRSRSWQQDMDTLLAKQAAGANLAITQLVFHADDFAQYVERARSAGVTMPIIPGIMPVLSSARLSRILELTDEPEPRELRRILDSAPDDAARRRVGIDFATALSAAIIDAGAPGIHLYTFNQHEPSLAVLAGLGLLDRQKEHA